MEMRQPINPLGLFYLLPLELMLEILYRLAVKSLLTLKCVCKPLNSIISDPKFAKDHFRLSKTRHYHLLICPWDFRNEKGFVLFDSQLPSVLNNTTSTITETMLSFPLNPCGISRVFIAASCDGIICFETRGVNDNHGNLVFWNIFTGKFKILPPLENLPYSSFDVVYSIGYDYFTDSYKVVAISFKQIDNSCETEVRVLTLGTNSWSTIPCLPSQLLMGELEVSPGKFVSGTINWVILDKKNNHSWVILSLDLEKEYYQEISQPDYGLDEPLLEFHLEVSRDCLCILAQTKTFMGIWVMKNYGNKDSWTKLFNISFATEFGHADSINQFYIFEEDDQLILDFFDQVYVYNYKNHTTKTPNIQCLLSTSFTSNVYVESLISP